MDTKKVQRDFLMQGVSTVPGFFLRGLFQFKGYLVRCLDNLGTRAASVKDAGTRHEACVRRPDTSNALVIPQQVG